MNCNVYNSLITTTIQITQVIVGRLSSLFFSVLRLAALRLPPCGTLSKATGFLHVPAPAAMLRRGGIGLYNYNFYQNEKKYFCLARLSISLE
jgi:hypothetical protein